MKKEDMNVEGLAREIKNFEGVRRKEAIFNCISFFGNSDMEGCRTIKGFGEDAAVLDIGEEHFILVAMDGIWGKLLDADPWWAGYCSVLVNVNDIAAMGGEPIAMVNLISTSKEKACKKLVKGMRDGVEKFGVPMVGGHVHPDTPYDALGVGIVGIVGKENVIFSDGARAGDKVVIAIDTDGRVYPSFNLAWDNTTKKSPKEIKRQIRTMVEIGERGLATAGKDISNPGTLGTLGMLLEVSGKGAIVDIDKIPRPRGEEVPFEHWLKMYPGTGFVLTVEDEKKGEECIEIFKEAKVEAAIVGEVDNSKKLRITDGKDIATVFDFNREIITGIKPNE
ncbi:MAG: methanogenesis marker 2 protein [Candidatus Methanospirareceae archaeon]